MPSPFEGYDWVDLSHTLEEGIPAWPTHVRFSSTLYESQAFGDVATHHGLTIGEHTGTHIDARIHSVHERPARPGTAQLPTRATALRGRGDPPRPPHWRARGHPHRRPAPLRA